MRSDHAAPPSTSPLANIYDAMVRAERWLDDRGTGAWVALIVLSFIFFWPVGLALLFHAIWGRSLYGDRLRAESAPGRPTGPAAASTGNAEYDAHRDDVMGQLDQEQAQFEAYIDRLHTARDTREFDSFLDDRARAARAARLETDDA